MTMQNRRAFLKGTGLACLAGASMARGAGDRITVAVLGGSRGRSLARELARRNVRVAYVCDPDKSRLGRMKREVNAGHGIIDFRRALDDKSVDAVVVATPDHWHVPASILALEAGKHVYVEKPCSHNIREGRLLVEAAKRTRRVVSVGTQSRSTTALRNGINALREGAIGDILIAKAWNSQKRQDIGRGKEAPPPKDLDYDMWVGPAPMRPFRTTCHHYTWHWWHDFGTGDAGNDGVHEIDIARWGLGVETHPVRASGYGGKMFFDDDQQFPDTQYVTFEYPGSGKAGEKRMLVYEHRIWSPYKQDTWDNGNSFYGTKGMMIMSKRGAWHMYGPNNQLIHEEKGGCSLSEHISNFLDAILSGRKSSADAETGHLSATLAHLANILARTGCGTVQFDPEKERITNAPEADALVKRSYRENHWAIPKGV